MQNLTAEQQQQLAQNLKLLDMAQEHNKVATIALYKGAPVVRLANPENWIRRQFHRLMKPGAQAFQQQALKALADRNVSPALKEQILHSAEGGSLDAHCNVNVIKAIKEQRKLLKLEPSQVKTTPIKERTIETVHALDVEFNPARINKPSSQGCYALDVSFNPATLRTLAKNSSPVTSPEGAIEYDKPTITDKTVPPAFCDDSYGQKTVEFTQITDPLEGASTSASTVISDDSVESIPYQAVSLPPSSSEPISETSVSWPETIEWIEPGEHEEPEAVAFAREEYQFLSTQLPEISLQDSQKFLRAYYQLCLLDNDGSLIPDEYLQLINQLEDAYQKKHLSGSFNQLKEEAARLAISDIETHLGQQEFQDLLADAGQGPRQQFFQQFVDNVMVRAFQAPSLQGRTDEKISRQQMELVETLNHYSSITQGQYTDDQSAVQTASTSDLKQKLHDDIDHFSLENQAFADFLESSKAIDTKRLQEKFFKPEALTDQEAACVVEARKLMLEMEKTIGRTWDQSLLTDRDYWGDDDEGYEAYIVMLELSPLCNAQIMAEQRLALVQSHQAAPKHPRVFIEGTDINGLLLAITQLEAGANVTLIKSPTDDDDHLIKLDPLWVKTLQFYLGDQFELLLSHDVTPESPTTYAGIIRGDGSAEVSSTALRTALEKELSQITKLQVAFEYHSDSDIEVTPLQDSPDGVALSFSEGAILQLPIQIQPERLILSQNESSKTCKALLPSTVNKNPSPIPAHQKSLLPADYSGRCTWTGDNIHSNGLNAGSSHRTVVIDDDFLSKFKSRLTELTTGNFFYKSEIRQPHLVNQGLDVVKPKAAQLKRLMDESHGRRLNAQYLTAPGQITIDMELPPALESLLRDAELEMKGYGVSSNDLQLIQNKIMQAWFTTVIEQMQIEDQTVLDQSIQKTPIATRSGVNRTIPSAIKKLQNRTEQCLVSAVGNTTAQVSTPGGEPLTAVREQIFAQQQLTTALIQPLSHTTTDETAKANLQKLQEESALDDYRICHNRATAHVLQQP